MKRWELKILVTSYSEKVRQLYNFYKNQKSLRISCRRLICDLRSRLVLQLVSPLGPACSVSSEKGVQHRWEARIRVTYPFVRPRLVLLCSAVLLSTPISIEDKVPFVAYIHETQTTKSEKHEPNRKQ